MPLYKSRLKGLHVVARDVEQRLDVSRIMDRTGTSRSSDRDRSSEGRDRSSEGRDRSSEGKEKDDYIPERDVSLVAKAVEITVNGKKVTMTLSKDKKFIEVEYRDESSMNSRSESSFRIAL